MNEIFLVFENLVYKMRSAFLLHTRTSLSNFFGSESITNLGEKLLNMVSKDINSSESLNVLKYKIKN